MIASTPSPIGYFSGSWTILRAMHLHQRQRLGRFSTIMLGLGLAGSLAGVMFGVLAAARTELGLAGALALCGGAMLAISSAAVLLAYINRAALQNTPANAMLVPGLNRAIRRTAVILWLAAMAGLGLFASRLPNPLLLMLAANCAIVAFAWLPATVRLPAIVVVCSLGPFIARLPVWQAMNSNAVLALCHALVLMLGWRALDRAFPCGGERHFARIDAERKGEHSARSTLDMAQQNKRKPGARPLYRRLFDADVAAGRPERLMLHALGPGNQRTDVFVPLLIMATIALAIRLAVLFWWPQHRDSVGMMAMMVGAPLALALPLGSAWRCVINLRAGAAEQAMFRLTPGAPGGPTLNQVLARQVLGMCLLEWLGATLLLLGIGWIWGASMDLLLKGATLACASLALAGAPLRDYARDPLPGWPLMMLGVVGAVGLVLALLALVASGVAPWLWLPLLAASLSFIAYRYRAMLAAPVAFPARRLQAG